MRIEGFSFSNIPLDEKSYENSYEHILIYDFSYKTLIVSKTLCIRFDEINRFIKIYDGTRYLELFGIERYDTIYDRIRYLKSEKSGITYGISHHFAKIRISSYNYLSIEKH